MLWLLLCAARSLTMINPIPLSYRFSIQEWLDAFGDPPHREAADPSCVRFKGEYWLFASKCGGYYRSPDLVNWTFIPAGPPLSDTIEVYAPSITIINETIYFYSGINDRRLYRSSTPEDPNSWEVVRSDFPYPQQDPMIFLDDDGRVFL